MTSHRPSPNESGTASERVSLHPLTFEEALEALLDAPEGDDEGGEDDGASS